MKEKTLRDFVQLPDGRIGLIVANDSCGGIFRGHYEIWFGSFGNDGNPVIEQLCGAADWKPLQFFSFQRETQP